MNDLTLGESKIDIMPIVKVSTNFGVNQLPENFMQEFTKHLADILGKPHGRMTWKLETDQAMSLLVGKL